MRFESLEDALLFAIDKENNANVLYSTFQKIVNNSAAKKLLGELAAQEMKHKELIENAMESGNVSNIGGKRAIGDVSFSDYMVAGAITAQSDPQDVMQYAMKMERSAYDLYNGLLENYRGTNLEPLFERLATEELKHKEILEEEYEQHFAQWM